jgi:hypothetical protein
MSELAYRFFSSTQSEKDTEQPTSQCEGIVELEHLEGFGVEAPEKPIGRFVDNVRQRHSIRIPVTFVFAICC